MDLTELEDIKKRLQEYRELYKKGLTDPDSLNGVVTYLEPDILITEHLFLYVSFILHPYRQTHHRVSKVKGEMCILRKHRG